MVGLSSMPHPSHWYSFHATPLTLVLIGELSVSRVQWWLYHLLLHAHNNRLPIRILKELLQTYTDSDASEVESLAEELIVLVISDTSSFVFDDLLEMAPMKKLEDQKIHKVCAIGKILMLSVTFEL